jgi:hypothetical protein
MRVLDSLSIGLNRHPGLDPGSRLLCSPGKKEAGCRIKSGMTSGRMGKADQFQA